ncbi:MAG: hypothetical protein GX564_10675 [Oligosphaeraceae bacterium]|nr:hypothetical protein [Oligosphaeraceae bacterium]
MNFPKRALFFDFHTMPANPDVGKCFAMDTIAERFAQIGAEYVVFPARCNLGTAYYNTEIGIRHPALQRDLLTELAAACHRRGIGISAYINAGLSHEEGLRHREWLILRQNGQTHADPASSFFRQMCYNSGYGAHLVAMAAEAVQHCQVDGLFLDCIRTEPCLGMECLEAMAQAGLDWRDEEQLYAYNADKCLALARRVAAAVQAVKPDALLYFNGIGFEEQQDIGNYLEFECLPTGGWGYETLPVGARYLRTLQKPVLNMTGRFHRSWGDFGGIRTQASLEYDCLYGIANTMHTTIGDHFHPRGDINQAVAELDEKVYRQLAALDPWTEQAVALTDIGLVMSKPYGSNQYCSPKLQAQFTREWLALRSATRMLCEEQQQFDVVSMACSWEQYPLLILPDFTPWEDKLCARLEAHLARGGKILASHQSGLDWQSGSFPLPQWGVRYLGPSPHNPAFLKNGPEISAGQPDMPITLYDAGVRVEAAPGTAVLGSIIAPYYNRGWDGRHGYVYLPPDRDSGEPAVTATDQVAYIANPVFTTYNNCAPVPLRQLVANLLQRLLPRPLLRLPGAPSYSRVTVTSQPGRRMVHFLAYLPERRLEQCEMIEEPLLVLEQVIQLREDERAVKDVYLAPGGEKLPFRHTGDGYASVTVPQIKGYALLVFAEE